MDVGTIPNHVKNPNLRSLYSFLYFSILTFEKNTKIFCKLFYFSTVYNILLTWGGSYAQLSRTTFFKLGRVTIRLREYQEHYIILVVFGVMIVYNIPYSLSHIIIINLYVQASDLLISIFVTFSVIF